eukprot:gene24934-31332_t
MFSGRHKKIRPDLIALGISLDKTDFRIDELKLAASLRAFHAEHNHLDIPLKFVVPYLFKYPKETWGYKLANATGPLVLTVLCIYEEIYDSVEIANSFVVPIDDLRYPKAALGMRLGYIMYKVKNKSLFKDYQNDFMALGISLRHVDGSGAELDEAQAKQLVDMGLFDPQLSKVENVTPKVQFSTVAVALEIYKSVHSNSVDVPLDFVVSPLDTSYPRRLHGFPLGAYLSRVIQGSMLRRHADKFEQMGVQISIPVLPYDDFYAALTVYKKTRGDVDIPWEFIVPADEVKVKLKSRGKGKDRYISYPEESHGMQLGRMLKQIIKS